MANPPTTIGPFTQVPAPGSAIGSAHHAQVAQYVTDLGVEDTVPSVAIGAGPIDIAGTSFTDWLFTSVTVPTWARIAIVTSQLSGVFEIVSGNQPIGLRLRLGSQTGVAVNLTGPGLNARFGQHLLDSFTLAAKGNLQIGMQVQRVTASSGLRADGSSACLFHLTFLH